MATFRAEVYDFTMRNYATRKIAPFPVDVPYGSYRSESVIEEDNDRGARARATT